MTIPDEIYETICEALDDSQLYTDQMERVPENKKAEWRVTCNAALAWLQAQQDAPRWEPVPAGTIDCDRNEVYRGYRLIIEDNDELVFMCGAGDWTIDLPDDVRLCRRMDG